MYIFFIWFSFHIVIIVCTVKIAIPPFPVSKTVQLLQNDT